MLAFDSEPLDLPPSSDHLLPNTNSYVVRYVNQNDSDITPAFRGKDYHDFCIDNLDQITPAMLATVSTAQFDKILESLLSSSADSKSQTHVKSARRLEFYRKLLALCADDQSMQELALSKLDNVLSYFSTEEKVTLARECLPNCDKPSFAFFTFSILRASKDLAELNQIVSGLGPENLWSSKIHSFREFVAQAIIGEAISQVKFPSRLDPGDSYEQVLETCTELLSCFEQIRALCFSNPSFRYTNVAQQYAYSATYDHNTLLEELNTAQDTNELCELINKYILMAQVEFRYGLNLTSYGSNSSWDSESIASLAEVLSKFGEGRILFTPLLYEIQRVENLGEGVLAARFPDGVIRVSDSAIDSQEVIEHYGQADSLKVVLIHEIGHSLQLGHEFPHIVMGESGNWQFSDGDPIYDFDEFLHLSGWRAVDPSLVEIDPENDTVSVSKKVYKLDTPVNYNQRDVIMVVHDSNLYYYDRNAKFSSRWYSRTTPWEDWAEALSEYFLTPAKLIAHAPQKFLHLELEFRAYQKDLALISKLNAQMKLLASD